MATNKPLIYASICSGIEAVTMAWSPLGWTPAWFAEIEPFCCALLKHHYPEVENRGDFTQIEHSKSIDVLVGGTPCQDFSVAGLRKGLGGARGNLTLEFAALAERLRSRWLVWENVPGILSIDNGRAFGTLLRILGECGYGFAYRVLDAQYFGVPQRRRRVFVVGYLGDWRRAAAVLFERESLSGHLAPSRETEENVARCVATGTNGQHYDWETETFAVSGRAEYKQGLGTLRAAGGDFQGRSEMLVAQPLNNHHPRANVDETIVCGPLTRASSVGGSHCEAEGNNLVASPITSSYAKGSGVNDGPKGSPQNLVVNMGVRRLTPRECERLQGFPDDYTLIPYRGKPAADGPRYRALGNSMAVPVMRWIGQRIEAVEAICRAVERRRDDGIL